MNINNEAKSGFAIAFITNRIISASAKKARIRYGLETT